MTRKFNINALIQKGKDLVFEYELPVGTILYRPLTDLEMDEAETYMLSTITDTKTREYISGASGSDIESVDFTQIVRGNAMVAYNIVLTATQDFADSEITIDDIKQLPGIKGLANEIKRASGYDVEVVKEVEEFRKDE